MEVGDFFQFHKFLAPVLIKIMYWVGLFFIVLGTLVALLGLSSDYLGGFSLGKALLTLVAGAAGALFWRVLCEVWIVVFSMNDRLGIIAGEIPRKSGPAA